MMRRMVGIRIRLIIICVIILGLPGCGEEKVYNAVSDTPVTFSFMYSGEFNAGYKSLEKMRKLTNVTLDVTAIPDSDYDTRSQLVINTGEDMPDLISKTKPSVTQALSGALLPISDYFDQMPNFTKFIKDNNLQYILDNATQADGKIYQLPVNIKEIKNPSKYIFIRRDIFDKYNIPVPETYEELYEAAKILKAEYPDVYPINVLFGNGNLFDMISPAFGTAAGWGSGPSQFFFDETSKEWIYAPISPEYKDMLEYVAGLYKEKLLHQEYLTYSSEMYQDLASTGKSFILMADWPSGPKDAERALIEAGETDAKWEALYSLEGPAGTWSYRLNNSSQTMVISAATKNKDYFLQLIRWLDWMYSEEGIDLFTWGVEGETYDIQPDGTKVLREQVLTASNPEGTLEPIKDYGVANNCFTFIYPYEYEKAANMSPDIAAVNIKQVKNEIFPPSISNIVLSKEEAKIEALYATVLNEYVNQMTSKFITGVESFDNWGAFVAECSSRGAEQLYELYNRAWRDNEYD